VIFGLPRREQAVKAEGRDDDRDTDQILKRW
jgi:hypothetical protein